MTLAPRPVVRRKDVTKFTDYCVILRAVWAHYQIIFEGSDLKRELLQNTAPTFFRDLNSVLIEHLILQICKLTDPESTRIGKNVYSNLTTQFLFNNADFSKAPRELAKLTKLVARINAFRARIVPARNKLIGHLDLNAAHRRRSQGRASVAAWHQFWFDLQDFLTIMHWRYVSKRVPYYLNGVGRVSDAEQLVKALQESTYFRALLADRDLTRIVTDVAFSSQYHEV
jgi:thermostable 8-oxoguanine DNA glycosylase